MPSMNFGPAVNGINRGIDSARESAAKIARGGDARDLVELQQSEQQVASNARSIRASNEALGSLIDVRA
jgi:hypothetical protein